MRERARAHVLFPSHFSGDLCSLRFDGSPCPKYATFLFRFFFISSALIRHFDSRYSPDYDKDNARVEASCRSLAADSLRRQVLILQWSLTPVTLASRVEFVFVFPLKGLIFSLCRRKIFFVFFLC